MNCHQRAQRHLNQPVTVFLTNGVKLSGVITDVDEAGVTLTRDNSSQDIFYHAIATLMPAPYGG